MDDIDALKRELAKAQAENAQLRAQIDAQRGGVDVQRVLDRIKAENESNKAYKAEMEATFEKQYRRDKKDTPSNPQTTRFF